MDGVDGTVGWIDGWMGQWDKGIEGRWDGRTME